MSMKTVDDQYNHMHAMCLAIAKLEGEFDKDTTHAYDDAVLAPWVKSLPYLRDNALILGLVLKYGVCVDYHLGGHVTLGQGTAKHFADAEGFPLAVLECIVAASNRQEHTA